MIVSDFKYCERWKKKSRRLKLLNFFSTKQCTFEPYYQRTNIYIQRSFVQIHSIYCHKFNFADNVKRFVSNYRTKIDQFGIHVLIRRNLQLFLERHLLENGQNIPIKCMNPVHTLRFRWEQTWALFAACDVPKGENIESNRFSEELYTVNCWCFRSHFLLEVFIYPWCACKWVDGVKWEWTPSIWFGVLTEIESCFFEIYNDCGNNWLLFVWSDYYQTSPTSSFDFLSTMTFVSVFLVTFRDNIF